MNAQPSKKSTTTVPADYLEIGKIVSAQGLQGEIRVYPSTDFPERFLEPGTRWLLRPGATQPEEITLEGGRYLDGKGLYVIQLEGIENRDAAEALQGCLLLVPESDRPPLEEDEYHIVDLIGLEVFDQPTQTLIGTVRTIIPAGNDLLEVELAEPKGKTKTVLIPFVMAIVPVVDLAGRRIEVTPPEGLIE